MASRDFVVKNGLIVTDDAVVNGTGAIKIPSGTTLQRPTGTAGDLRFNTDSDIFEGYNGTQWVDFRGWTGSRGYTGSQGDTGFTGSQGTTGFTGSQGAQGERGFTGSQGDKGDQGIQGIQGERGFTGSRGDTGFVGSSGTQGSTGFTGSAGAGFTGSQGGTGYTGSQGPRGFTGSQGFLADTSDTAPTGIQDGHMWFNTNTATLNVYYDDGDSQQWVTTSGPAGPIGYTGSQGVGFTGSQGVRGYTGSAGDGSTSTLTPEEIIAYSTVLGGW